MRGLWVGTARDFLADRQTCSSVLVTLTETRLPSTLTNTLRDFNKNTATSTGIPIQNLNEPAVFVIKKNSSTLRNLIEWLKEYGALGSDRGIGEPMLIIDDEADNASINIRRGAGEVSTINGQIRELLELFDKSCYIGYTATPFANIFHRSGYRRRDAS